MPPVLIGRFEPGSPEWHAARANGLGGSEIAPILGLSPYESRFSLWHRKAGNVPAKEQTPEMEWGNRLEAAVVQKWLDVHPEYTSEDAGTYAHTARPWQIANPDRIVSRGEHRAIIEAKTSRYDDEWGIQGTDEIPVHYRCQVLWYLDVLELDIAHVIVLIGGSDYREYVVHYDAADAKVLRDRGRAFIESLQNGDAPRPDDGSEATWQAIRHVNPEIDGSDIEVPDPLAADYVTAHLSYKAAEVEANRAKTLLFEHMGTARRATWEGQPIATRQSRNGSNPFIVAARKLPAVRKETAA